MAIHTKMFFMNSHNLTIVNCIYMLFILGVQSVYEDVALDTNRGHTVKAVCETFNLAKDAGFKVVAHMMPNLPNVDLERDVEQFIVSCQRNK